MDPQLRVLAGECVTAGDLAAKWGVFKSWGSASRRRPSFARRAVRSCRFLRDFSRERSRRRWPSSSPCSCAWLPEHPQLLNTPRPGARLQHLLPAFGLAQLECSGPTCPSRRRLCGRRDTKCKARLARWTSRRVHIERFLDLALVDPNKAASHSGQNRALCSEVEVQQHAQHCPSPES